MLAAPLLYIYQPPIRRALGILPAPEHSAKATQQKYAEETTSTLAGADAFTQPRGWLPSPVKTPAKSALPARSPISPSTKSPTHMLMGSGRRRVQPEHAPPTSTPDRAGKTRPEVDDPFDTAKLSALQQSLSGRNLQVFPDAAVADVELAAETTPVQPFRNRTSFEPEMEEHQTSEPPAETILLDQEPFPSEAQTVTMLVDAVDEVIVPMGDVAVAAEDGREEQGRTDGVDEVAIPSMDDLTADEGQTDAVDEVAIPIDS